MSDIGAPIVLRMGRPGSSRATAELHLDRRAPIALHVEALERWLEQLKGMQSTRQLELERLGVIDLAARREREAHG